MSEEAWFAVVRQRLRRRRKVDAYWEAWTDGYLCRVDDERAKIGMSGRLR